MEDMVSFIRRASERCAFKREFFSDKNLPTVPSNIVVFPFFGDIEGHAILATYLCRRFKEELKSSKYFIMCSWPGLQHLYPYVDEYWSVDDTAGIKDFCVAATGMANLSDTSTSFKRNLNFYFENVLDSKELKTYYDNGFTGNFWQRFKQTARYMPMVPSINVLGGITNKLTGGMVFLSPFVNMKVWRDHRLQNIKVPKEFWIELVNYLHDNSIKCVVWQNNFTHNISTEVVERSVVFSENSMDKVLAMMRAVGCTLDVFQGIGRLSYVARSPFVSFEDRNRFMACKIYEVDDLGVSHLPRDYVFSFTTIIESGGWKNMLFPTILKKVQELLSINKENLPTTGESYVVVPYEKVRERKLKRIGAKFIKFEKDLL